MARAKVYDEYEDVGATFPEETLEEWSPGAFAQERKSALIQRGVYLTRRLQMNLEQPQTTGAALKLVQARAGWLVRVVGDEGLVFDEAFAPPAPTSKAGKELTLAIHARSLQEWAEAWMADASDAMRYYVTISRRAAVNNGWTKATHSLSNKVANALHQEVDSAGKVVALTKSISRTKAEPE